MFNNIFHNLGPDNLSARQRLKTCTLVASGKLDQPGSPRTDASGPSAGTSSVTFRRRKPVSRSSPFLRNKKNLINRVEFFDYGDLSDLLPNSRAAELVMMKHMKEEEEG
jgi:hypothetical protein